ncbi:MAG: imelysin family protein [Microthrixaceae bacterium]
MPTRQAARRTSPPAGTRSSSCCGVRTSNDSGPGTPPVTDYTTEPGRRAPCHRTSNLLADQLVADLTLGRRAVGARRAAATASEFLADPVEPPLPNMFRGIGALTVGELAGERIAVALETADQEDEHSCFSDNTNADVHANALGVQWVYLGTYPAIEAGPGLDTLVEGVDVDLNTELTEQIAATVALTESYTETFDSMLVGNACAPGARPSPHRPGPG